MAMNVGMKVGMKVGMNVGTNVVREHIGGQMWKNVRHVLQLSIAGGAHDARVGIRACRREGFRGWSSSRDSGQDAAEVKETSRERVGDDVQAGPSGRGRPSASDLDLDKAAEAIRGAQLATRMLFPWERRQLDGPECEKGNAFSSLMWWEKLYWVTFLPTISVLIAYTLSTNSWDDLRRGELSPSLNEKKQLQLKLESERKLEELEMLRMERLHAERKAFGIQQQRIEDLRQRRY